MPRFIVPTNANIHAAHSLLATNHPFDQRDDEAVLSLHPKWVHVEPLALSMIAAWGAWCRRQGYTVRVENLGKNAAYAARMRLFQHLKVEFDPGLSEREEAGRFLPLTQVRNRTDVTAVIANISAMLHLHQDPESLAAVQYSISELLRNVLEHSGSKDGAFVSAHRYTQTDPHRVTIAVADCGRGIASHLSQRFPEVQTDDTAAHLVSQCSRASQGLYPDSTVPQRTRGRAFSLHVVLPKELEDTSYSHRVMLDTVCADPDQMMK